MYFHFQSRYIINLYIHQLSKNYRPQIFLSFFFNDRMAKHKVVQIKLHTVNDICNSLEVLAVFFIIKIFPNELQSVNLKITGLKTKSKKEKKKCLSCLILKKASSSQYT